MSYSKENLTKLLSLVSEISQIPENNWFLNELIVKLNITSPQHLPLNNELVGVISADIEQIRKYLKIDVVPIIDYSGIIESSVRTQLFRDCLEMGKYRLGKINDTINFDEFCRYAHLQAEELINYYFWKKNEKNIEKIADIIKNNSKYLPSQAPINLNQIDYGFKLKTISKILGLGFKLSSTLHFLKDLRNELSHRNTMSENKEDEYLVKFLDYKLEHVKPAEIKLLSTAQIEIYNKVVFIKTKREQDFNKVYDCINNLKNLIINNLIETSKA